MSTQNIGQILKKSWQESGLSQKEFADKMDMSVRNLQYLFEKEDIHISQLALASAVLQKDFISIYLKLPKKDANKNYDYSKIYSPSTNLLHEGAQKYSPIPKTSNEINVQISIKGDFTIMSKYFPDLISKIKREAESYGLTIA